MDTRMKREARPYRCEACGHETMITTNHTEPCWNHCPGCSWKGIGYATGMYLFGSLHRFFVYAGK